MENGDYHSLNRCQIKKQMNIGNLTWINCVYYIECPDTAFLMW